MQYLQSNNCVVFSSSQYWLIGWLKVSVQYFECSILGYNVQNWSLRTCRVPRITLQANASLSVPTHHCLYQRVTVWANATLSMHQGLTVHVNASLSAPTHNCLHQRVTVRANASLSARQYVTVHAPRPHCPCANASLTGSNKESTPEALSLILKFKTNLR